MAYVLLCPVARMIFVKHATLPLQTFNGSLPQPQSQSQSPCSGLVPVHPDLPACSLRSSHPRLSAVPDQGLERPSPDTLITHSHISSGSLPKGNRLREGFRDILSRTGPPPPRSITLCFFTLLYCYPQDSYICLLIGVTLQLESHLHEKTGFVLPSTVSAEPRTAPMGSHQHERAGWGREKPRLP